ncbi:MAG: hypothetical protein JXD21_00075 [Candidatus Omnitrophica bacterium]|nr:hypothetical protein [Candidatus Omnitrophota bacterium]
MKKSIYFLLVGIFLGMVIGPVSAQYLTQDDTGFGSPGIIPARSSVRSSPPMVTPAKQAQEDPGPTIAESTAVWVDTFRDRTREDGPVELPVDFSSEVAVAVVTEMISILSASTNPVEIEKALMALADITVHPNPDVSQSTQNAVPAVAQVYLGDNDYLSFQAGLTLVMIGGDSVVNVFTEAIEGLMHLDEALRGSDSVVISNWVIDMVNEMEANLNMPDSPINIADGSGSTTFSQLLTLDTTNSLNIIYPAILGIARHGGDNGPEMQALNFLDLTIVTKRDYMESINPDPAESYIADILTFFHETIVREINR